MAGPNEDINKYDIHSPKRNQKLGAVTLALCIIVSWLLKKRANQVL
jgi:hypothetical protein